MTKSAAIAIEAYLTLLDDEPELAVPLAAADEEDLVSLLLLADGVGGAVDKPTDCEAEPLAMVVLLFSVA